MNKIHHTIELFLKKYQLDKPEKVYLCAFSGGYDSMCLLNSLKIVAPQNKIIAIHLNHNWRGEESDLEEQNCKDFCNRIRVEFYCEKLPSTVPHTETAARDARYNFFEKCKEKFESEIIFTAHNQNDNAETLIYRICKGTGIPGLCGIAEKRGFYYRPLLHTKREEIEKYCKDFNLNPNNDSSNTDTTYKRNFIRAEILPKLQKINPNSTVMINSLSEAAKEDCEIVEEYLNLILNKISIKNKLKTQDFLQLSTPVQKRIVYNIFIQNNLDYDSKKITNILEKIKENSTSKSGKTCSLTTNLWIFVNYDFIEIIRKKSQNFSKILINKTGNFEQNGTVFSVEKCTEKPEIFPKENANIAYVNLENFDFNFELRPRQEGDIITPFGMNGTQKIKKYLNSKKIPKHEKENLLFFAKKNEILWAINVGLSNKVKVTTKPTHKLTITRREDKNEY